MINLPVQINYFLNLMKVMFGFYDQDGDGWISRDEMTVCVSALYGMCGVIDPVDERVDQVWFAYSLLTTSCLHY